MLLNWLISFCREEGRCYIVYFKQSKFLSGLVLNRGLSFHNLKFLSIFIKNSLYWNVITMHLIKENIAISVPLCFIQRFNLHEGHVIVKMNLHLQTYRKYPVLWRKQELLNMSLHL